MSTAAASMKYEKVKNYYGGEFVDSQGGESLDVVSPIDGTLLSQVPMSPHIELDPAVVSAKAAPRTEARGQTPIHCLQSLAPTMHSRPRKPPAEQRDFRLLTL